MASSHAYCFSKASRVRRSADFQQARELGRAVHTPHLVLVCSPGSSPCTRLGLVASRRVGSAVVRNRGKRLVRDLFRCNRLLFPEGVDLIVILKAGIGGLSLQHLLREVERAAGPLRGAAQRAARGKRSP